MLGGMAHGCAFYLIYAQYLILGSAVGLRLPFVDRDNIIRSPLTTCQTKVNAYHGNTCTAKYDALA
jgi:hypothetical protein